MSAFENQLEKVAIIAMYCHVRPPDAIAFPTVPHNILRGFKSELHTNPMPFHLVAVGRHVNAD